MTPGSGVGRLVPSQETAAVWPHITRGDPRSAWRHLSNNGSYIEAIFDDLADAARVALGGQRVERMSDAAASQRLARCTSEYVALRDRSRAESTRLQAEVDTRDRRIDALRSELQTRQTEFIRVSVELDAAREAAESQRHQLDNADLEAALEERQRERSARLKAERALKTTRAESREQVAEMQAELQAIGKVRSELQAQLGEAIAALEAAEQAKSELTEQLALAKLKVRPAEAKPQNGRRGAIGGDADALTQLTLSLGVTERIADAGNRDSVVSAAHRVGGDPDAAVAACRRVLERCARSMWAEAFPDGNPPPRFSELMWDLRSTGDVTDTDWHQMKTLYSRASAIVHEGGATREAALSIWLGTAEIAELASARRPE